METPKEAVQETAGPAGRALLPILQKAEIFASLGKKELTSVIAASAVYQYKKGERVFATGDPGDALYIIVEGRIAIQREAPPENPGLGPTTVAEFIAGDTFGELELMNSTQRNASAVAEADSNLLMFPRRGLKLERVLTRRPAVSARILYDFMKVIAGRIRSSNARVKENSPWVQELRRQMYSDKLTGLYNKTFLEENLPDILKIPGRNVGLLMFKPDNFKDINDTYGHEAGDSVLKAMALALARSVGKDDPAVRYMGNELAVVLPERDRAASLEEAKRVMALMNSLDIRDCVGGAEVHLSVSIGVAVYPGHAANAAGLIAAAHELPLIGRARGGNRILFPEDK